MVAVDAQDQRRAVLRAREITCCEPRDAGVEVGVGDAEKGSFIVALPRQLTLRQRHTLIGEPLATAVEPLKLLGDHRRALFIVAEQQFGPKRGAAHATGGVDSRPQPEADVGGVGLAAHPRALEQSVQPRSPRSADGGQPVRHQRAVLVDERYHVGHRAESYEVECLAQELRASCRA